MEKKGNKHKSSSVSYWDVEELAALILNKSDEFENEEIDSSELDELIYEKFDCTMESFHMIVENLLPLTNVASSPITNEVYRGFSIDLGGGHGRWIIKEKIS